MTTARGQLGRTAIAPLLLVGLAPLVLAGAGLMHPTELTPATARHWRDLHLALIPVFPLLGLAPWLAAAGETRWVRILAAVLGFVYAVFYGALDVLAGVGAGAIVLAGHSRDAEPLFTIGNTLSFVGVAAYLVATLVVCVALLRRHRARVAVGAVLVLVGSISFLTSHIYWPRGVLTMLVLAAGWLQLVWISTRPTVDRPAVDRPTVD